LLSFCDLVRRLPPRSTLFPYTTLFRSRSEVDDMNAFGRTRQRPRVGLTLTQVAPAAVARAIPGLLRLRTDVDHPCSGYGAKDTGFLEAFVAGVHDSPDGSTMRSQETRLVSISTLSRLAPQPGHWCSTCRSPLNDRASRHLGWRKRGAFGKLR